MNGIEISIIVPVFNSAAIIKETVDEITKAMEAQRMSYEIILVDDGSTDASWDIVQDLSDGEKVVGISLLRNYGQHSATMCGIEEARGEIMVTIDDDLQNDPRDISKMVAKIQSGHDVVFGSFKRQDHGAVRSLGSSLVQLLNERIFAKPRDLQVSSFRAITREVAEHMMNYNTSFPYIQGLMLMFAAKPANVEVSHQKRSIGSSNYNIVRIAKLLARILFNYSSWPLKTLTMLGFAISAASLLFGLWVLVKYLLIGIQAPGWTTIVLLLSLLNGFIIIMLGVIGEYVARIMKQISFEPTYVIKKKV